MSRLPGLRRDELGPEGRLVWEAVVGTRGGDLADAEGVLAGPFNAFVHAPAVGSHLAPLGAALRFGTSLGPRLTEVAILAVAARWQADYEWWAHSRLARQHGVGQAVIDAIGRGEEPPFAAGDERVVYTAARGLAGDGRLSEEVYSQAQELLGEAGMVELVSLCGYYTLISFLLNAFEVPAPPGAPPGWHSGGRDDGRGA